MTSTLTQASKAATLDAIISTTEDFSDYIRHYTNTVTLLHTLSTNSTTNGIWPLVIFTSGCKDYGPGPHLAHDPHLSPHTEDSPLNPPALLALRTEYAKKIMDHKDAFAPVLVRPTNVHGRSASLFAAFFDIAAQAAKTKTPLVMTAPANSICHCMHVNDCAEVEGQIFNISARRYETVGDIGKALMLEYGIFEGLEYVEDGDLNAGENPWPLLLLDFLQWVGSEKLQALTGWRDRRPLFSEAIHVFRLAYEVAEVAGYENVKKVREKVDGWKS